MKETLGPVQLFFLVLVPLTLSLGCAPEIRNRRFAELLRLYPAATEPLKLQPLPEAMQVPDVPSGRTVTIMVHPGYSLFLRDAKRSVYSKQKYDLLKQQFFQEARFINESVMKKDILILIIPGNYEQDSEAPASYTSYLNLKAARGKTVFYLRSETSDSGGLMMDDVVKLHAFLSSVRAKRVLVGGGFIGRCQEEFYRQVSKYVETVPLFVVPEISSISPDDISSTEASNILDSIRNDDYRPVVSVIFRKMREEPELFSLTTPKPVP